MKRLLKLFAAVALGCTAGCATVNCSDVGGHKMVYIANSGWYLFNVIPIASGNPDCPNECDFKLFKQTTTMANNIKLLDWAVASAGAESYRTQTSYTTDENVLFILFKRHVLHTSAELVDAPPKAPLATSIKYAH